jgi:hypothetical protein
VHMTTGISHFYKHNSVSDFPDKVFIRFGLSAGAGFKVSDRMSLEINTRFLKSGGAYDANFWDYEAFKSPMNINFTVNILY